MLGKNMRFNLLRKYKTNNDGATAIEFAILSLPFFVILFSIMELAVILFIGSSLNHGMQEASRRIRTGEFQASCASPEKFKEMICDSMGSKVCGSNIRFDVVSSQTGRFQAGLLPTQEIEPDPTNPEDPAVPPNTYTNTNARDVVIVRAQYFYKLTFPGEWTRLANTVGNTRIIESTTAFRNEPFPNQVC